MHTFPNPRNLQVSAGPPVRSASPGNSPTLNRYKNASPQLRILSPPSQPQSTVTNAFTRLHPLYLG